MSDGWVNSVPSRLADYSTYIWTIWTPVGYSELPNCSPLYSHIQIIWHISLTRDTFLFLKNKNYNFFLLEKILCRKRQHGDQVVSAVNTQQLPRAMLANTNALLIQINGVLLCLHLIICTYHKACYFYCKTAFQTCTMIAFPWEGPVYIA